MYADFHCYPAKVAYDSQVMAYAGHDKEPLDPWHIPQSNLKDQANARSAVNYSQCDLAKSTHARVKLLFAALYPIEKGFFQGVNGGKISKLMVAEFYKRIHFEGQAQATNWLWGHLRTIPGLGKIKKHRLGFLQNRLVRLPLERIMFLQENNYDYFEELKREYKFYLSKAGERANTENELRLQRGGPQRTWEGVYQLAQSGNDVLHRLRPDNDDVVIVLTLEGIHSLGVGNPEDDLLKDRETPKDVSIGRIKSRIRQLKGEEPLEDGELKRWLHQPFYITFSKYFNNTLCGHARSLPSVAHHVFDQSRNMDKGIVRNAAYSIMLELLGLDDGLNTTDSKRILIDVKHMSAASREDFYKKIIRPHNRRPENIFSKIPIVASHVGYSGVDSLETLTTHARKGLEFDNQTIRNFKAWNINLCDEDVIEIHDSGGLIGITLDQELLGVNHNSWIENLNIAAVERRKAKTALSRTIEQFVRIPFDYRLAEPHKIWDVLCIGTGFDGSNNPLNGYSTVLELNKLEDDLVEILEKLKRDNPKWFEQNTSEALARKICFENAYEFVVRHYNKD